MTLSESVDTILAHEDVFGELFYPEFFRRCPEAEPHFKGSDMQRQSLLVTMTLTTIQQHASGTKGAVEAYLVHLGAVHRRRSIPLELYPEWRGAMLSTLRKLLGEVWDTELRKEWENALDSTIRVMLGGYEHPRGI